MAVSGKLYYPFLYHALHDPIDIDSDNLRVALHTASASISQAHEFRSSVTNEITGTGYTADGQTLSTPSITYSTGTTTFDADNAEWTTATIAARYAVVFKYTGSGSGSDPLIGYVDFGETMSSSAGTFTIAWSSNGIFTITTD
jgi:propanediol dehydratase large subunit